MLSSLIHHGRVLAESLIEATGKMGPKKVIYVSCNPATLVRDIKRFADQGYHVTKPIQPGGSVPTDDAC
jgi:23S rRNA (uracil1939-C5)-methyltransferase